MQAVHAATKDAVFQASIEFIGTLTGMTPPPHAEYCKTCNAPQGPLIDVLMRCGPCAVINGKLPPTKYIAVKAVL